MEQRQHDTVTFDAARVALKGASDLADSIDGGLHRGDRVRITVEGNVTERKEITRTNGLIEWVKVIEVDNSYGLEVVNRLTEIPFPTEAEAAVIASLGDAALPEPMTVDAETGEVIHHRPRSAAKEPARETATT